MAETIFRNICWYFEFLLVIAIVYYVSYERGKFEVLLVIGVFSSPDHFKERQSLRETWLNLAEPGDVKYYFVLGSKMCSIPPEDRISPYGCEQRNSLKPTDVLTSIQPSNGPTPSRHADGFGFVANHNIAVTHLGLPQCLTVNLVGPVRVQLKDGVDGKTVASVTFESSDVNMKAIPPVAFPRLAEGFLVADLADQPKNISCCSTFQRDHGAITFASLVKSNRVIPLDSTVGLCPFMQYKVLENYTTADINSRSESWKKTIAQTYQEVQKESEAYDDILLVNVTDVYRNLPQKLVKFLSYVDEKIDIQYLMKTDDDTLIDLRRVLEEIRDPWTKVPGMWWWSTFREYWKVPRAGKWREERFLSATYPPFPCGGGYVLNQATVRHLAAVAEHLAMFQGEDVSLGIWLSGVNIQTHRASEHADRAVGYKAALTEPCEAACTWACDARPANHPRCNLGQLTVPQVYTQWEQFKKNGVL